MKQRGNGATPVRHEPLFAASNSGHGFHSFYREIFGRGSIVKRYIIKGGPGTGKSSFLRGVADAAAERGIEVEPYRCSSDPDSLDAVILDGRIALLDGTAPHAMEPECPGARDEIINLGAFWNGERLGERYNEIVSYGSLKSAAYAKAYRFLSAAMEIEEINRSLTHPFLKPEKIASAARRSIERIPAEPNGARLTGLAASIGMKGRVRMARYEREAAELFLVDDSFGTGCEFLSALIAEGARKGCAMRISYDPLMPNLPDAVLFLGSGRCYTVGEHTDREPDGRINMKRFLDTDGFSASGRKTEYRINRRLKEALLSSAEEALGEAGRYHFELERIYGECMDFEAERRFLGEFCEKLF